MMNRIYKKSNPKYGLICLGSSLAILVAGCSSDDIALDPTHATYSYEQVKDQPITLPANYNKNNFRKLLLGVAVNDIGVKAGEISPNVVQTLSSRLQTEMAKLKRFSVFSAHNRGGVVLFQSLADVGEAKVPDKNPREMDLILSASITVSKEKTERKYDVITLKGGNITETTKTEITGAERNKLFPTDVGIVVTDFLDENFPEIMDYNFTADVEKQFDEVAEGKKEWTGLMHDFYENFEPQVEKTLADKSGHKAGERQLGIDPQSGRPVFVKIGRYGPMVQIGQAGDEEKPVFATMKKGQSTETLTLEEALELFKLPRTLGEFEDKEVSVGAGRFGPYIKHDGKYVSLPKDEDPLKVSLEKAVELILAKREAEAKRFIKSFEEDPEMEILNGPYGPYISYKKKNYRLPKDKKESAAGLTFDECMKIINAETEKPKKTPRARGKKKA